ncbi:MAG: hypothetical protein ACKO1T_10715 [Sediminibacterium sp.]
MKNLSLVLLIVMVLGVVCMSCASTRSRGCPTTNPNYFRQGA